MKRIIYILLVFINLMTYATVSGDDLSFKKEPFINPKIIEDMSTWISDNGDQVVAINLDDSQESNRYYCDYEKIEREGEYPYIGFEGEYNSSFGYQYVGELDTDLHVIKTYNNGGGSQTFVELMFVRAVEDRSISYNIENNKIKEGTKRTLLYKVGSEPVIGREYRSFYIEDNKIYETK